MQRKLRTSQVEQSSDNNHHCEAACYKLINHVRKKPLITEVAAISKLAKRQTNNNIIKVISIRMAVALSEHY